MNGRSGLANTIMRVREGNYRKLRADSGTRSRSHASNNGSCCNLAAAHPVDKRPTQLHQMIFHHPLGSTRIPLQVDRNSLEASRPFTDVGRGAVNNDKSTSASGGLPTTTAYAGIYTSSAASLVILLLRSVHRARVPHHHIYDPHAKRHIDPMFKARQRCV